MDRIRKRSQRFTTRRRGQVLVTSFVWSPLRRSSGPASAVPPAVTLLAPTGGEVWTGGTDAMVEWSATDTDGTVTEIQLFYRDADAADWTMVARKLPNTGQWLWPVHNTPTTEARVRIVAIDNSAQSSEDVGAANFTILQTPGGYVPTTLRDFELPGSQPFAITRSLDPSSLCQICHGGYDPAVEPANTYFGSMMHHAARDPLFFACLAIAEQDAPSSGDMCIRCHTPGGWLDGRSQPTDGSRLTQADRDGVSCDFCHKMVDPIYEDGISPVEDLYVLQQLDAVPTGFETGQYVVDPSGSRRGPFDAPDAMHPWIQSPFHQSGDLCGTCHSVSNPAFTRVSGQDYAPNALDAPTTDLENALPLERTYHEWKFSDYNTPTGIYAPEFAGNKPGGYVSTCEDCHMRDASGYGCNSEFAPLRPDVPVHDLTGGNTFVPLLVRDLYPSEVDDAAIFAGIERARYMLQNSAELEVTVAADADSFLASVTVTNQTGHKLPTGYPEGRRMWINLQAFDAVGTKIYESAAYDTSTAILTEDEHASIYEAKMGISPALASAIGQTAGESFHFVLNDSTYKDNRIPPRGFTNANFDSFGGMPVEDGVAQRYPDGQYWDTRGYPLPAETDHVIATLYYQTMSKEYADFLRDENTTNDAGDILHALWTTYGKSRPEVMVADTASVNVTGVEDVSAEEIPGSRLALSTGPLPFRDELSIRFRLDRPTPVRLEVFDPQGRRVYAENHASLPAGPQSFRWTGVDQGGNDAGSGVFWLRVTAEGVTETARVVRIR
ncbi:MAG: FlgD immunoglobulin-like domain containing protein [Candidatus Eisenbacteria bacterium]